MQPLEEKIDEIADKISGLMLTATFPLWFVPQAYLYAKYVDKNTTFKKQVTSSWRAMTRMPIIDFYKVTAQYPERRQILKKYERILSDKQK